MTEEKREGKQKKEPVREEKAKEAPKTQQVSENTVFVGRRPLMNYVVACMALFNTGCKKAIVKARSREISRAVDTVELLRRVFVKDLKLQRICLGTEQVTRREEQKSNVSAIEITVTKP